MTSDFIRDKEQGLAVQKKLIQAHLMISVKYKQRTDGFVIQNFPKLAEELDLVLNLGDSQKQYLVTFWEQTGGSFFS